MFPGGFIDCRERRGQEAFVRPIVEKMEQYTADGGEEETDELEERDGGFHGQTFRGEGMGIVYVGEQGGMRELRSTKRKRAKSSHTGQGMGRAFATQKLMAIKCFSRVMQAKPLLPPPELKLSIDILQFRGAF